MYYGRLSIAEVGGSVISYNQINEEMIINGLNMHKVEPTTMGKTSMGKETTTKAYDYIVVAVPASSNYNVTQDNGFGKKVPFREEYQGANGIPITINGEAYKLYGEIILTQGEKFIYID